MNASLELYEILMYDDFSEFEARIDDVFAIIPELMLEYKFDQQNPAHDKDVWEHTLYALSLSNKCFTERFALLLHDIGKRFTATPHDGRLSFPNHPEVSYKITKDILKRFDYEEEDKERILKLIKYHDTPITFDMIEEDIEFTQSLLNIQKCDAKAHHPAHVPKREKYIKEIEKKLSKIKDN